MKVKFVKTVHSQKRTVLIFTAFFIPFILTFVFYCGIMFKMRKDGLFRMKGIFRDAMVYDSGVIKKQDMLFDGVSLSPISFDSFAAENASCMADFSLFENSIIIPGLCDVHVHFREPGFSYKERILTGTLAAARGGFTACMTMPNLSPTPDNRENLRKELEIIGRDAKIAVFPFATVTKGEGGEELADYSGMLEENGFIPAFSDDGKGVQSALIMKRAMAEIASFGGIISAHCEENSLLNGGYIHDGDYAKAHGHRGISSASEYVPILRDIELVKKTGVRYHVCHISTKESVEAIRRAKACGVNITCETAPHYLVLDDSQLEEDGRFKMNPPIRDKSDKDALVEGLKDGTVDMIATDHAPHSKEEKGRGLEKSLMGVVGLETAFPILYEKLVKNGIISLERLVAAMSTAPRERFGITSDCGFTVFDTSAPYTINPDEFLTMGRATPFEGERVSARCILTVYGGKIVYKDF